MWNCRVSHGPCRHLSWRFLWWGHVMVVRRNWDLAQQRRGSHRNRTAWAPQSSHIDKSYRMLAWYLHACSHVTTYMHTLLVHMHTQHLHTCTHSTYKLPCSSVSSSINGDHNNPRRRDVESTWLCGKHSEKNPTVTVRPRLSLLLCLALSYQGLEKRYLLS